MAHSSQSKVKKPGWLKKRWDIIEEDARNLSFKMYPFSLVLNDVKFIILGMIAGYIIFTVPDQARDNFVNMFGETKWSKMDHLFLILFWCATCFWSFHAWAGARSILYMRNYEQFICTYKDPVRKEAFRKRIRLLQKYLPRILSVIPFIIVVLGINAALCLNWIATVYMLTGVFIFVMLTYRRQFLGDDQQKSDARFSLNIDTPSSKYIISMWFFGIFFLIYLYVISESIIWSQRMQSMLIVSISINLWTYIFMWLEYWSWKFRISLLVVLLILFYSFSMMNNNHEVRSLNDEPGQTTPSQPDISEHYAHFLANDTGQYTNYRDTIYIVATQGGGIRAAYWTTYVLMELAEQNPMLRYKLYAISGASGGTFGAAVYLAYLKKYGFGESLKELKAEMDTFYRKDFLAPITAAYLGPDLIQKFLPVKLNFIDRARYLEKSWEAADHTGLFTTSFSKMFQDTGMKYNLPLLMINSTWIETGQRTVIAPVKLSGNKYLIRESYPLMDYWGGDLRLSTAVGMGARFPLLTPGAVVRMDECHILGTFADGGYVENTGIATAIDIKDMIKDHHHSSADSLKELVIHLIYIENGDTSGKADAEPIRELYETKTVVNGFYNSWDGQDKTTASKVTSYVKEYLLLNQDKNESVSLAFTRISLPRQTDTILPLGWVLSTPAKEYMKSKVSSTVTIAKGKTISSISKIEDLK